MNTIEQLYADYEDYCAARREMGEAPLSFEDFLMLETLA